MNSAQFLSKTKDNQKKGLNSAPENYVLYRKKNMRRCFTTFGLFTTVNSLMGVEELKSYFLPWVPELQLNSAGSCEKEKKV